jgi:hypothetical protein
MNFKEKRSIYASIPVLERRWKTRELIAWTDDEIAAYAAEVERVAAENDEKFQSMKRYQLQERAKFRALYPKRNFPAYLTRSYPAPNLRLQWKALLKRRHEAIRAIEKQKEQRKTMFLDRMSEGRVRAMERREAAIRKLIQRVADIRLIELTERATDKRLEELFRDMGVDLS